MQIAGFSMTAGRSKGTPFYVILKGDGARTSAPGLRAFRQIADNFDLSEAERKLDKARAVAEIETGRAGLRAQVCS